MSARSMARARERELTRETRRSRRRVNRGIVAAAAIGVGVVGLATPAQGATFTVNSTADAPATACDATCTLRDAVSAANAGASHDTITFAPSVTGEISLDAGAGHLPIDSSMTIQGPGADALAVDGNGASRIAFVRTSISGAPYEPVTVSGLTLRDGRDNFGSAIYSFQSDLTLNAVTISNNHATNDAAAFAQGGSLTVVDALFTENEAEDSGAALYTEDTYGPPEGGTSRLVIRNSSFTGNHAADNGGAIYVDDDTDSALITGTTIAGNATGADGGGIEIFGVETGAIRIEDSTITGNTAAESGGGISVYNRFDRPVEIVNTTIAGNSAAIRAGGIYNYATDKAAYEGTGDPVLSSTIVAGNVAPQGPDLANRVLPQYNPISPSVFVTGFSLIGSTAEAPIAETPPGSNVLDVNPQLGVLAENGGPTQTLLPAETSPAIDAGIANGLAVDQRGQPRTVKRSFAQPPGGDGTDIGAVELQDDALNGAVVKAKRKQGAGRRRIAIKLEAGAGENVNIEASGSIKAGRARARLKHVMRAVAGGEVATLRISPTGGRPARRILKAIAGGRKGRAKLAVVLTDPAGNSETRQVKVTLKG